ncbi:MAG TPA: hypothetical protein VJ418_12280, partial [Streptosporangiaceae bacterium]|nr:hypothetical protein [Streptosporangiaceae bacterium]
VLAAGRARRRRRRSALTAAAAATAGAAAVAATLTLGGAAPARSGPSPTSPPSPGPVKLAAFSVTDGPGHSTTLTLYKGTRLDPSALREDLARHGIPALVTVGTFCRSTGASVSFGQVVQPSTLPDGTDVMVINGAAMPPGTRLSIGYFAGHVRLLLIKDGAPLSCSSTSGQPAVHITPSGTPIRG